MYGTERAATCCPGPFPQVNVVQPVLLTGEITEIYGQTAVYCHFNVNVQVLGSPRDWILDSGADIEAVIFTDTEPQTHLYIVFSGETPSTLEVPTGAGNIYSYSGGRVVPVVLTLS